MDKRVQKRLKRDALDNIMQNNPKLNDFLNALTENETPELKEIVQASIQDALGKARMVGVQIGYIGALLWIKSVIKVKGTEEVLKEIDEKVEILKRESGVKSFYDVESE